MDNLMKLAQMAGGEIYDSGNVLLSADCIDEFARRLLAAADAEAGPVAWISHNVLTGKSFYGNLPMQSLQPGVYRHTKLFDRPTSEHYLLSVVRAMCDQSLPPEMHEWWEQIETCLRETRKNLSARPQPSPDVGVLVEALKELVDLKALKDRIESADLCTYGVADAEAAQNMADEYQRRKLLAWESARDALAKWKAKR